MAKPFLGINPWPRKRPKDGDGNQWDPAAWIRCETDGLVFDGPESERPDETKTTLGKKVNHVSANDEGYKLLVKGFLRPPTDAEIEEYFLFKFPGLTGKCFWIRDDALDSYSPYNCYGWCMARDTQMCVYQTRQQLYEHFKAAGYAMLSRQLYAEIPAEAEIAVFSGDHAARRGSHLLAGTRLWESKLGQGVGQPRILHELSAIEGLEFGDVLEYWWKPPL